MRHGCASHTYVLMINHVHLLVTPSETGAASRMTQASGRRDATGFNARYRRTGTPWEGRFKEDTADLRLHTQQQKPWGSDRFRRQVGALTQRAAGVRPRRRPRSADKST